MTELCYWLIILEYAIFKNILVSSDDGNKEYCNVMGGCLTISYVKSCYINQFQHKELVGILMKKLVININT